LDFTLLQHNNARSGRTYAEFSIGTHFPLVQGIRNSVTGKLNCYPSTPGILPVNPWGFANPRLRIPALSKGQRLWWESVKIGWPPFLTAT